MAGGRRVGAVLIGSLVLVCGIGGSWPAVAQTKKPPRVYTNDDIPASPSQERAPAEHAKPKDEPAEAPQSGDQREERLAPFVGTPMPVVEKMLDMAKVTAGDVVYDLGSGDGRIVIMAAQKYGAKSVGVELDRLLVEESREAVQNQKLERLVTIIQGDLLKTNLKDATVVAVYLLTGANGRLRPILEKDLKPGTRVVAHDMGIPGWRSAKEDSVTVDGVTHFIYLYEVPQAFKPQ